MRFLLAIALLALLPVGNAGADDLRDEGSVERLLSGRQAFAACAGCHSLAPGAPHKVGPNLYGIVGSRAASREGYAYSPALTAADIRWTREELFAWIAASERRVPGSWMLYDNMLRPQEVQALISYLAANAAPAGP